MADTININGVQLTPEALSEIQYLQEPDITRLTLDNIDTVVDFILNPVPQADDPSRLDMVTTLHNLSKFIKTLTKIEALNK